MDVRRRYQQHLNLLKRGTHCNPHLQHCYNKHGEPTLVIVEEVGEVTEEELRAVEQTYLDVLDFSEACNISKEAGGGRLSDAINEKRREGLKKFFAENPDAIRGKNNPFYGRSHTQETRDAISRANRGLKRSEEWKAWKSADMKSRRGSHHSEEHKQLLSERWSGDNNPSAQSIEHNGVTYPSKKELMNALGLTNYYQLYKFLNA